MKSNTNFILGALRIFFWIFTVVLAIVIITCGFIFFANVFGIDIGSMKNMKVNTNIFHGTIADLQELGKVKQFYILLSIIIIGVLQLLLFLSVIKAISKLKLNHPFSVEIYHLISRISKLALSIGILSFMLSFIYGLINREVQVSIDMKNTDIQFLLLSAIVYVVGEIYKRGVDLQTEHELTI